MFDQKIVILVVLGVAIYFLTRPTSHRTPKIEKKNNSSSSNEIKPYNSPSSVVKETFANPRRRRNIERFSKRQRTNDPLESHFDEFPGDFTAKEIVDSSEDTFEDDSKAKAHLNKSTVDPVTTGNAFGRLLPEGTDPNAMPDVEKNSSFNKDDFLPKHSNKKWFDKVVDLDDSALFKAKPETFIGVDTQGQSLRNASRDLRGEVGLANPRGTFVWNNPTIGHDNNRKPMVIGNVKN